VNPGGILQATCL